MTDLGPIIAGTCVRCGEPPSIIAGTIWTCPRCGTERRRRVVPVEYYDAVASLIREAGDEVVLLPVTTLNAIAERAERKQFEAFLGGVEAVHDGDLDLDRVRKSYNEWVHR